jgi:arsenate reductase
MTKAIRSATAHQRPYQGFDRAFTPGVLHGPANRYMPSPNDMSSITIWHNPRCSKSCQTLQLIRGRGVEPTIVEYLKTPPSTAELSDALDQLGLEPRELMRKMEAPYKELSLGDEGLGRAELIAAMVENPVLIERPVVFRGKRAVLGRPPENVLELID